MPFNWKEYDAKCAAMDTEQLQREWDHYTRLISGASTSTAMSAVTFVPTAGVSAVGIAVSAPVLHNARKKRDIIDRHLKSHGTKHHTCWKRDVVVPVATSAAVDLLTMGAGSVGVTAITNCGVEYGIHAIVANPTAVQCGVEGALATSSLRREDLHSKKEKEKEKEARAAMAKSQQHLLQIERETTPSAGLDADRFLFKRG